MDVHRDFCEVAIAEPDGKVRSAGRVASTVEALEVMAQSLAPDDVVALEATSGAGLIADLIRPHVGGVTIMARLERRFDDECTTPGSLLSRNQSRPPNPLRECLIFGQEIATARSAGR